MESISINSNLLKSYPRYAGLTTLIYHKLEYKLWLIEHCLNIYVDKEKSELFFGDNGQDKYIIWKKCPFLTVDNVVMYVDVKKYWKILLDNKQYLYTMIDTEIAGISEGKRFFHDVLITGYEEDSFWVWDFFPPNYTWRRKKITSDKIVEAYSKCEIRNFDGFFAIEENDKLFRGGKIIENALANVNYKCISDTFYWISDKLSHTTLNNYDFAYIQFVCDYIQVLSYLEEYLLKEMPDKKYIYKVYKECVYIRNYYLKCVVKNDKKGFKIVATKVLRIGKTSIEFIRSMREYVFYNC